MKLKIHDTVKVISAPMTVDRGVIGSTGKICQIFKDADLYLVDCGRELGSWYLSENEVELVNPK
jgi:hypothetical protein